MQPIAIDDTHHVARHIKPSWILELNGKATIIPQAFLLTDKDEGYLSANWMEYFNGLQFEQLSQITKTTTGRTYKPSSAFATGKVAGIKLCSQKYGHKVRILHEPNAESPSYAVVRQYRNSLELALELAEEHWCNLVMVSELQK